MTHMPSVEKDTRALGAVDSQVADIDFKNEKDEQIETQSIKPVNDVEHALDRFGADTEKSEEEKRLVRKLDFRIM